MIRIAVDCMGGDNAPAEIVRGAALAVADTAMECILVGDPAAIEAELAGLPAAGRRLTVVPASDVIGSAEAPVAAVRKKKNSSLVVAVNLVRDKAADAVLSAGNTGAFMAASLFALKRLPGVDRPALSPALPTRIAGRMVILLDVGANLSPAPVNLLQYGIMGSLYAERIIGVRAPRIGLLNIGTEDTKGNNLYQEAYTRLRESRLRFIGNIEARDIFKGEADVIVCDGFTGNAVLKASEGLSETIFGILREEFAGGLRAKIGTALLLPVLRKIWHRLDYTEYGGAPLLGVDGVCIKSHGNSNAKVIRNGLLIAWRFVEHNILREIEKNISGQEGEDNG